MNKRIAFCVAALAALTVSSAALAGGGGRVRLQARMTAGNDQAQAKSVYQERTIGGSMTVRFKVEAEDFAPGTDLPVSINGNLIGTAIVNDLGVAEIQFRTIVDEPGDGQPLPNGFPRIQAGDTISVGSLSGVYAAR